MTSRPTRRGECAICRHGVPMDVIGELDHVWVTAQLDAPLPGYLCIVSKTHVREPFELPEPERAAFWRDVDAVAQAVEAELRPTKLNYEIHGNSIPHLHLHLFPRYPGDPFEGRPIEPRETVRRTHSEIGRLRTALSGIARQPASPDRRQLGAKLVRDLVPVLIEASGQRVQTRRLEPDELLVALRAKVDEELAEYDTAASIDEAGAELADVMEVLYAIARQRGIDPRSLDEIRQAKADARGRFDEGFLLLPSIDTEP